MRAELGQVVTPNDEAVGLELTDGAREIDDVLDGREVPHLHGWHASQQVGRVAELHGDKAHDFDFCRQAPRRPGITPRIARRGVESGERLGRVRGSWNGRTLGWSPGVA